MRPKSRGSCQHQVLGELVIGGIARHHAPEADLGSKAVQSQREINAGIGALMRIDGIVALVLNEADGGNQNMYRLGEQRDQIRSDERSP